MAGAEHHTREGRVHVLSVADGFEDGVRAEDALGMTEHGNARRSVSLATRRRAA